MAIQITPSENGKVLEVRVTGTLVKEDYARFVPEFDRLIQQHGKVRLLFEMVDFHGWKAGAAWEDLKVGIKHFTDIERLAMVGDKQWEKGMSIFCRPFTTAQVRYFDQTAAEDARAWLREP